VRTARKTDHEKKRENGYRGIRKRKGQQTKKTADEAKEQMEDEAWKLHLNAGESISKSFSYKVKYPSSRNIDVQ